MNRRIRSVLLVVALLVSLVIAVGPADATSRFTTRKYCSSTTFPVMVATMTNTTSSTKYQGFGWSPASSHPGWHSMLEVRIAPRQTRTYYLHAGSRMGGRHDATIAVHQESGIRFSYYTYCSRWA